MHGLIYAGLNIQPEVPLGLMYKRINPLDPLAPQTCAFLIKGLGFRVQVLEPGLAYAQVLQELA